MSADCEPGFVCLDRTCRTAGSGGTGMGGNGGNSSGGTGAVGNGGTAASSGSGGTNAGGSGGSFAMGGNAGNGNASAGGTTNAGGAAMGGSGGTGGSAASGATGGSASGGSSGGGHGGTGGGGSCGDVFVLSDRSTYARWATQRDGMTSFLQQVMSATPRMGITFLPVPASDPQIPDVCHTNADCGNYPPCNFLSQCDNGAAKHDSCDVPDYTTPAVALDSGNIAATSMVSAIGAAQYSGRTALRPALEGTLSYVRGQARTGYRSAIVLITDGTPSGCLNNNLTHLTNLAATAWQGTPRVAVYVINLDRTVHMDSVADAGGTGSCYIAETPEAVADALGQILLAEGCQ
ncbi:MAG: VWA domain-containing protein [Myxococcales bacterium]|nr:VWA domain-containing protein [Myxococcales bacterium]